MLLTPARVEDVASIAAIEAASFAQPWLPPAILGELTVPEGWHHVARVPADPEAQAAVVGYILTRFLADEMHIMKLAVEPAWRRRGTATALLEAAQREALRRRAILMLLEVRKSNRPAIGFYREAGFQIIGVRPNYYPQTGEDALVMSKRLKEEP